MLDEDEVRGFFTDSTVRDWGDDMYGGHIQGSLARFITPLLSENLLPENAAIACYDNQDSLMADGAYSFGYGMDLLPFYSAMRPGPPGFELDWGAWAYGIDYWEDAPTLAFLSYYFWTP
jgi:hypothetical protein